ncbi:MAG: hypothetical protein KC457_01105 [Myxococcales bacterium]|nr:hypothetical protein [Myxococcales bacterium]
MRVQPKVLVRRLSPVCTGMLEAAVGRAATGQYYEIVPEHLLLGIIAQEDGDAAEILKHFGQDRLRLQARLQKTLEGMKTGNAGRPTFAESLFQWIEDAWTLSSLLYGISAMRTGHLLLQFAERASRYTAEDFPEIEAIDTEVLRRDFANIVLHSNELDERPSEVGPSRGGRPVAAGDAHSPSADSAIGQFTVSLTQEAREGRIDPIFGRHREIRQCIDILARRRKNNPIIVGEPGVGKTALVEGLALAIVKGEVPEEEYLIPIGKADIKRPGADVTVVTWGQGVPVALDAAALAEKEGIDAEVIDLRTLRPLDDAAVIESVKKTNRCALVYHGWPYGGVGAELAALFAERAILHLDAPILRVTGEAALLAGHDEAAACPSAQAIAQAIVDVVDY